MMTRDGKFAVLLARTGSNSYVGLLCLAVSQDHLCKEGHSGLHDRSASKDWTDGNALFGKLTASGQEGELLKLVNPEDQGQIEDAVKIAAYLNLFELIAVATKQNAMGITDVSAETM